jgi:adenosylcobyric acid synthase
MGSLVHDPDGLEGRPGSTGGLNLLPVETDLKAPKTTTLTTFSWRGAYGRGYEIHMGQTRRLDGEPLFQVESRNNVATHDSDGCFIKDFRILGTYIHGIFENPQVTARWLDSIGLAHIRTSELEGFEARNREYDLLAEYFEEHIDVNSITELIKESGRSPKPPRPLN